MKVKFECDKCGCYFYVEDRNKFECPNCLNKELFYAHINCKKCGKKIVTINNTVFCKNCKG